MTKDIKVKLIAKNIDINNYEVKCSETTVDRLEDIIYKQNRKMLKQIAIHYKWNYFDLCDKFLKK